MSVYWVRLAPINLIESCSTDAQQKKASWYLIYMHNVMTQVISLDWIIDADAITFVCLNDVLSSTLVSERRWNIHDLRKRETEAFDRELSSLLSMLLRKVFSLVSFLRELNESVALHNFLLCEAGSFRLKRFGLISSLVAFSHMPTLLFCRALYSVSS